MTRICRAAAVVALSLPFLGCAGGAPLLHPAKTLERGDVRAAAGLSGQVAVGSAAEDLRNAREQAARDPTVPGDPGQNPGYAKGALVAAAVAPGLAPFVSGRVGLGYTSEGGISYTGRAVRIDVRKSLDVGHVSYSLGAGLTVPFYGRAQGQTLPQVDLASLHGYGADVPLLVGWESSGGLYQLWAGARGAWQHVVIGQLTSEPRPDTGNALSADSFSAGGLVGLAIGFRHVHVALELDAAYVVVNGRYNANEVKVTGAAITPASAVWWSF